MNTNECVRCGAPKGEGGGCKVYDTYYPRHLYTDGPQLQRENAERERMNARQIRTNRMRMAGHVFGPVGPKELEEAGLSPRERMILEKRFGLSDPETQNLEETGKEFGLTRERIRQLEAKALKRYETSFRNEWRLQAIERLEMALIARMLDFQMWSIPPGWVAEEAEKLKRKYGAKQTEFWATEIDSE